MSAITASDHHRAGLKASGDGARLTISSTPRRSSAPTRLRVSILDTAPSLIMVLDAAGTRALPPGAEELSGGRCVSRGRPFGRCRLHRLDRAGFAPAPAPVGCDPQGKPMGIDLEERRTPRDADVMALRGHNVIRRTNGLGST